MIRRPPRSTRVRSSAASDVYKRQILDELPDDPRHLVTVELDDGVLHCDLAHACGSSVRRLAVFTVSTELAQDYLDIKILCIRAFRLATPVERCGGRC